MFFPAHCFEQGIVLPKKSSAKHNTLFEKYENDQQKIYQITLIHETLCRQQHIQ
jgi:hypothetical protein